MEIIENTNVEKLKENYLQKVLDTIYDVSLKKEIKTELSNHIEEQLEELLSENMDAEDAMRLILTEMGSPSHLGKMFRQVHSSYIYIPLLLFVGASIFLYTGSLLCYLDFPSLFTVLIGGILISHFFSSPSKHFSKSGKNLGIAFLDSGIFSMVLSFLLSLKTEKWNYLYLYPIMLPLWYGLLLYLIFHFHTHVRFSGHPFNI